MDYISTIDYLFNQLPVFQVIGPGAYKPGLHTAYTLSAAFGNPHLGFKSIHIAGTNGKGSTAHMLASVLAEAGYKVGLYTSPHIFDFRERIRINGDKISESAVVDFVDRYLNMHLDCAPSFFELTTIMAFEYFSREQVDIAVIETGLGGRLDTTNILTPELSVITNVSLDHTALLGHTAEEIAAEKAGIIKAGVPVVIGEAEGPVRRVFENTAAERVAEILFAEDFPYRHTTVDGHHTFAVSHDGECDAECELTGDFQSRNINTVLTALNVLDIKNNGAISRGLARVTANTHLLGRWTRRVVDGHQFILDTGHNIGAWQYLAPMLCSLAESIHLHVILGFSNDKEINHIFSRLPRQAQYYFVTPSVKRGRDSRELLALGEAHGLTTHAYDTVMAGYDAAVAAAGAADIIFVGGSNFVVADLPRKFIEL